MAFAYNLSLTLTIHSKNWSMGVKNTKLLEADCSFDGQHFERPKLSDEGDEHPAGKAQVYHLVSGSDNAYVTLGNAGEAEFRKENMTGLFEADVVPSDDVRYQAHNTKCKFEAKFPLKLQLAPPGTPAVVFQKVKCKLTPSDKNC